MSKRKIAACHNVRIVVAKYEHIDSTFYAEEEIEYESEEERIEKESKLNNDVVDFLIKSMRELPERLGKKTEAVQQVEQSIKKAIPEWLENDPVPNIANIANI